MQSFLSIQTCQPNRRNSVEEIAWRKWKQNTSIDVSVSTSERSSLTDLMVEMHGGADDELATPLAADRRVEMISYSML